MSNESKTSRQHTPWARTKLFDLSSESQDARRHQASLPGGNRNNRPNSPKTAGGDKRQGGDRKPFQANTGNNWRGPNNQNNTSRSISCFICKGPHLARECPNRIDFNAFQATLASDSDDRLSQTEGDVGQIEEGENPRMGALMYVEWSHVRRLLGQPKATQEHYGGFWCHP